MELVKRIFVLFLCVLFLVSCAPTQFIPREMKMHKFEPRPIYEIEDDIITPEKPVKILLDKDFKITTNVKEAKYIAFTPEEYKKVQGHVLAGKAYKKVSEEQIKLINAEINISNNKNEYIILVQLARDEYKNLHADSENLYRQEQHQHKMDNIFHKAIIGIMGVGAIIIAILAL